MRPEYDVVVIGAGPAGSVAARTTAQAGLSTLLVEKRQEIGSPVRCGEAVGSDTVARFISLDPKWIAADVDHFRIYNALGDAPTCRRSSARWCWSARFSTASSPILRRGPALR